MSNLPLQSWLLTFLILTIIFSNLAEGFQCFIGSNMMYCCLFGLNSFNRV